MPVGTVMGSEGGVYSLLLDGGGAEVQATLRGRLKQDAKRGARIVVGDRVEVAEEEGAFTVEALLPRKSTMVRRGGHRTRVLAANVDRVFLVLAVEPAPWPQLIDRLLVVAEASQMPVVIVINKLDLPGGEGVAASLVERYAPMYPVLPLSAKLGVGLDALRALACHGTSAFMGPSGVGKSTILNVIEPGLRLRTGELSEKARTGRHTTVSSRLIPLSCGGAVADTPGFSDPGDCEVDPAELDLCFPEMRELRDACRFGGCAHLKEPDCAVRAALADGRIVPERYDSYKVFRAEAVAGRER